MHFGDASEFAMTLGDLARFVERAKARGVDDSDAVFPEYEGGSNDTELTGFTVILGAPESA